MDVPNNNRHLVEESSNSENKDVPKLTLYAQPRADIFQQERKGKRKQEREGKRKVNHGNDGIITHVNDDEPSTSSRCTLRDKKHKLSLDYQFTHDCEIDLNLTLSIGTHKNTTHKEDTTHLRLPGPGPSEHHVNQNKSKPSLLLFNFNLLEPIPRVTSQHGPDTPEVGAPSNNIIPEPDIVEEANLLWSITKVLTKCDVWSRQNRLLIEKDKVHHIRDCLDEESRDNVEKGKGVSITVFDKDCNKSYDLIFTKFLSTQAYIINGSWYRNVVTPRELKKKDEIGLRWNKNKTQLVFSVLNRAPPQTP